jgi:hypothetical protein
VNLTLSAPSSKADRSPWLTRLPNWAWLDLAALAWGLLLVLLAFTDHDRGSTSDPDQAFHHYTLVHDQGVGIIAFVGIPAAVSLVLLGLLYRKSTRGSYWVDRLAWTLAGLSCVACLVGLVIEGLVVVPAAVLTVWAVAITPLNRPSDRPTWSSRL